MRVDSAGKAPDDRVSVLGLDVDPVGRREAVDRILSLGRARGATYVVSANLHAARLARADRAFERAMKDASVVIPDGAPIVRFGRPFVTERVAGADLVAPLIERAGCTMRLFFICGSRTTRDGILAWIERHAPQSRVVGTHVPPGRFHANNVAYEEAARQVHAADSDIIFVGLGMPRQELWARWATARLCHGVIVCVGAGLDFLADTQSRAPAVFRRYGLEWLYRAGTSPRRLGLRYIADATALPFLALEHRRAMTRRNARSTVKCPRS